MVECGPGKTKVSVPFRKSLCVLGWGTGVRGLKGLRIWGPREGRRAQTTEQNKIRNLWLWG